MVNGISLSSNSEFYSTKKYITLFKVLKEANLYFGLISI